MNTPLSSEFEKRINEKDQLQEQQLKIVRLEVARGFEQLTAGEKSSKNALDIFDEINRGIHG